MCSSSQDLKFGERDSVDDQTTKKQQTTAVINELHFLMNHSIQRNRLFVEVVEVILTSFMTARQFLWMALCMKSLLKSDDFASFSLKPHELKQWKLFRLRMRKKPSSLWEF